ncbi:MAG: hypothetical protein ABIE22_00915 [archaeon]
MKKKVKRSNQLKSFKVAFSKTKLDKRYWKSLFLNALSSAFTALLMVTVFIIILSKLLNFIGGAGGLAGLFQFEDASDFVNKLLLAAALTASLTGLLLFLFRGFFKGVMWQVISQKKFKSFFRTRFLVLRILFLAFLIISLPVITSLVYNGIDLRGGIYLVIFIFMLNIYYFSVVSLIITNKLRDSLKKGILNAVKVHRFLIILIYFGVIVLAYVLLVFAMFKIFSSQSLSDLLTNLYYTIVTKSYSSYTLIVVAYVFWLFFVAYLRIFYFEFVKKYFFGK